MECAGGLTAELRTPGFHCGRNNAIPGVLHGHGSGESDAAGPRLGWRRGARGGTPAGLVAPPPGWDVISAEPSFPLGNARFRGAPSGAGRGGPVDLAEVTVVQVTVLPIRV